MPTACLVWKSVVGWKVMRHAYCMAEMGGEGWNVWFHAYGMTMLVCLRQHKAPQALFSVYALEQLRCEC
eukprot:7664104-Ditylum_brightwellii.AAC.1